MIVHLGLALLVVVNLAFVHVTGVVESSWVLAFAALTLLSPLLRRLTDRLAYRIVWNLGVVVLFAGLVQRTLSQGIERMLEGGLVLAAFCQVHLVNNVSSRQRPDLLLFNSFLIALITSFFCQELAYSGIFVAYAFTLLIVWRMLARRGVGGERALPMVLGDGAKQATFALAATFAVFLLWPRDFEREGLVGSRLLQAAQAQVGFADEIRLNHRLAPVQSDRVVMKIRGADVPTLWRGSTFAMLRSGVWHAERVQSIGRGEAGLTWREEGHGRWTRLPVSEGAVCEVEQLDTGSSRLFMPLSAVGLQLNTETATVPHMPLADGTFAWFGDELGEGTRAATYRVVLGDATQARQRQPRVDLLTSLDLLSVPPEALSVAQEVRRAMATRATSVEIAEALAEYLRVNFAYGLPGQVGSATNLGEFFTRRRGHCEFFASALAIMLRSLRVPCRLVGGFLVTERDREGVLIVRARHAHAWVEVFDANSGWCSVDATPASEAAAPGEAWYEQAVNGLRELWAGVTGFDRARREAVFAWLSDAPRRAFAGVLVHPWSVAVVGLAWWWLRRRRSGRDPSVAAYQALLRRLHLQLEPGETPRQLLARARAAGTPQEAIAELVAATNRHERARYAGAARHD